MVSHNPLDLMQLPPIDITADSENLYYLNMNAFVLIFPWLKKGFHLTRPNEANNFLPLYK